MGKGGYNGGSTIVGPKSGWFSGFKPKSRRLISEEAVVTERKAKPSAKAMLAAARTEARKIAKAKRIAMKAVSPPHRDPDEVERRLSRRMNGVVVEVRSAKRTGKMLKSQHPKD